MYIIIVTLLLGFGLYELANTFIILPSRQSIKAAKRLQKEKKLSDDLRAFFVEPLSKHLVRFIKFDQRKRAVMARNLERVKIPKTPERFYADAAVISLWVIILGLLWIFAGAPFITILCLILAVWLFFSNINVLKNKISETDNAIRRDLPKFVSIYSHARGNNVKLVDIVEKYRKTACKEFHYDLDLLIMDLKTDNEETALMDFAERVNITQMDSFVNILIGGTKGEDIAMSLRFMDSEMRVLMAEEKHRKLLELPDKVRGATIATGVALVILAVTPIIIDLIKNIQTF